MRRAAVSAFAGALHCGVSGGVSLAVGPLGRQAEVTMQVRCQYRAGSLYSALTRYLSAC